MEPNYLIKGTLLGLAADGDILSYSALLAKYKSKQNVDALERDGFIEKIKTTVDMNDPKQRAAKAAKDIVESQKSSKKAADVKEAEVEDEPEIEVEVEAEIEVDAEPKIDLNSMTLDELNQYIEVKSEEAGKAKPISWPYKSAKFAISYLENNKLA